MKKTQQLKLLILAILAACIFAGTAGAADSLDLPVLTETKCEWDGDGRLIRETAYDLNGAPAVNTRGFHRAEYSWDPDGNLLSESYTGLNGEAVNADGGYARAEFTYGKTSGGAHLLTEDRYGADGQRAAIPGSYSYRRDTYDGNQILATEYFDAEGNPARPVGGYAKILYNVQEDENARVITKTYYAADGSLLTGSEGGAKVIYTYALGLTAAVNARVDNMGLGMLLPSGERGEFLPAEAPTSATGALYDDDEHGYGNDRKPMLVSTEIYGAEGEKVFGTRRYHREVRGYDERGNLTRIDYYDGEGELMISAAGFASMVNTYDDLNRVIQIDYLDREGNLVKMINGYARVTYEYHGGSEKVHYERFFGADGERTMISRGMSMIEYEYDGGDWDYRETYYDILDGYTQANGGFARLEKKYDGEWVEDEDGNRTWVLNPDITKWEKYYGPDLQLIERKAGYAGYENTRNDAGQVISTVYMDDTWHPTRNEEHQYARIDFRYDSDDPKAPAVYEAYFDENGEPTEGITGAYARTMVYGGPQQNLLMEERFLNEEDEPDTSVQNGAHRVTYTYDRNLLQTSAVYSGTDGQLSATRTGMAALYREYNRDGQLLWEATFGEDGKPITVNAPHAVQVHTYDYSGHHTGEKFYGTDGDPVTSSSGYASAIFSYDEQGNIAGAAYFNAENEPTLVNGSARIVREYDNEHHMTSEAYFGTDGQPIFLTAGYAARKLQYDPETGETTRVDYLGTDGNPVLLPQGYASYEVRYDFAGNMLLRAYYDEAGGLTVPGSPEYAKMERKTDAQGRVTEELYYGADGNLLANRDGYAGIATAYEGGKTAVI